MTIPRTLSIKVVTHCGQKGQFKRGQFQNLYVIRGCQNCRWYGIAEDGRVDSRKNFQFGILTTIALFQLNHPHYKDAIYSLHFKYVANIPLGRSTKIARN